MAWFPMKEHHPCNFRKTLHFCIDASIFLLKHPKNTIAVHCKAGKGRTGYMIVALLVFRGMSYNEAINLYGARRSHKK